MLDLWNIKKGGYVQTIGAVISAIIAFGVFFVAPIKELVRNTGSLVDLGDRTAWIASGFLIAALALSITALVLLQKLNGKLKDARYKPDYDGEIVRVWHLGIPTGLVFAGGFIYYFLFLLPNWPQTGAFLPGLAPFLRDVLLVFQFACTIILFFVSNEYLNWLGLRFKLIQTKGSKPEGFSGIGSIESVSEESASQSKSVLSRVRDFIAQLSPQNIPAFLVNIAAVLIAVFAAYLFGDRAYWEIMADTVFALVTIGGFVGVVALAVSTGGFYQKGIRKYLGFGFLGVWHAALQILTTIILVDFGDWRLLIAIFLLTVLTNGLGPTGALINLLLGAAKAGKSPAKNLARSLSSARFAAWIMKKDSGFLMLAVWLIYGAVVVASPFMARQFFHPLTAKELIDLFVTGHFGQISDFWIAGALLLAVAFYVGYRMSRLWFSWYLGVSLLFNGHNNEAGGAARIEGFKHILRIKVEKTKLTVHVIGFDQAETDIEDLKPRLVDKFELHCETITNT